MSTFFQQTAQAMIAKHIDRFPLLKLDQVIDWQPIEQYLNRQRTRYLRDHRGRPPIPCYPCSKPSCSDNGTASPIPKAMCLNLLKAANGLSVPVAA